jgi:hypothetical protein
MGIVGAALAWTARVSADAVLLFGAVGWLKLIPLKALARNGLWKGVAAVLALGLVFALLAMAGRSVLVQGAVGAVALSLFVLSVWAMVLDESEKAYLTNTFGRVVSLGRAK